MLHSCGLILHSCWSCSTHVDSSLAFAVLFISSTLRDSSSSHASLDIHPIQFDSMEIHHPVSRTFEPDRTGNGTGTGTNRSRANGTVCTRTSEQEPWLDASSGSMVEICTCQHKCTSPFIEKICYCSTSTHTNMLSQQS
jgi:hypothetical protein